MPLTDNDRLAIREEFFDCWDKKIKPSIMEVIDTKIRLHQAECPTTQQLNAVVNRAQGAAWASGKAIALIAFLCGSGGVAIATVIRWLITRS